MAVAVSAGTGVMNSLLVKLSALLGAEYKLLKGVRKEIEFLERELSSMKVLLQTLAEREKLDEQTKDWRNKVRELSYDIEDCIDHFMHRLETRFDAKPKKRFMRKTMRRLKTLWESHQISKQIQELKSRVTEESERRQRYRLEDHTSRPTTVAIDPRLPALYAEAKGLVGTDGPREEIIGWLKAEEMELKVVSIVGCGGLGKTTLAMEVFSKIGMEFESQVKVSVSQTLNLKKLLRAMLFQINKDEYNKSESWEVEQLIPMLRQCLKDKRYFIIIDDIWSKDAWKHVMSAIPENNNQSRIITTTRVTDVAKACCFNSSDHIYEMVPLNDDNSQMLFFKRIFPSDSKCPSQLEEVSNRILKKCGGLPLAITTIASLLATKSQRNDEWQKVHDSICSAHENDCGLQGMRDILSLSYLDLPNYLKSCLLYLSIYPEDCIINKQRLIWRWIAEGLITKHQGQRLDQVAEVYFNELVNRSMIQPVDISYDGSAQTCRVHDMVLDFIISLSIEENFVSILRGDECISFPNKIRRLSLQSCYKKHGVIQATIKSKSCVRSLSFFGSIKHMLSLLEFKALRVLDLQGCYCLELENHIKNIGSLFQLRYLSFGFTIFGYQSNISELPVEIGNLQYLETLDMGMCTNLVKLPPTICRLCKLVRLFVWPFVMFPDDVANLQSLEELSYVTDCHSINFVEQLGGLTKMRVLKIYIEKLGNKFDDLEGYKKILALSLSELGRGNLRSLQFGSIDISKNNPVLDTLMNSSTVMESFTHLQKLCISLTISKIPKGMALLVNLMSLSMIVERMEEKDLYIIRGIPTLLSLQLVLNNLPKQRLVVSSQGFENLKEFNLSGYQCGIWIVFEAGAMPRLQKLFLEFNAKETMSKDGGVDFGIEHLSNLKHLHVTTMGTEVETKGAMAGVRRAATLHPNCPTLDIHKVKFGLLDATIRRFGWLHIIFYEDMRFSVDRIFAPDE